MTAAVKRLAAIDDLLAIPEERRFHEIIAGELVQKAMPSPRHGRAQRMIGGRIGDPYDRKPGSGRPGGWWIMTEVEVQLEAHEIFRPDVVGWRRERLPGLPDTSPIEARPDWVCEILSRSNARNDLVKKMRVYHRSGVPHYWIVDPDAEILTVYRWAAEGFMVALTAERGEHVRPEPFVEIDLDVEELFGEGD